MPDDNRDEAFATGLRQEAGTGRWYAWLELAARLATARKGAGVPSGEVGRLYYRVPFARKEEAKAVGMKFDNARKLWFAPSAEIAASASALFALGD